MKFTRPTPYLFSLGAGSALLAAALWLLSANAQAALTHRYSFTNGVTDSVGGADGTIQGDVSILDGSAIFPGASNTDYIELPPGLITNYTTVTFELWVNVGENGTWTEIYAFGNQTAAGEGANMVMFCPHSGSTVPDFRMSYAQSSPGFNDERIVSGVGILDSVGPVSVTCVYDPPNSAMTLYTNGTFVATLSPVPTQNNKAFSLTNVINARSLLGRSLYNGDAPYNGTIDEFRIYNTPLSPLQVYVNNAAGPDTIVTNIAVNSLTWNVQTNMTIGSLQSSTVTFNTANYGSVTLPGATEPTYQSINSDVVSVTAQGQLFAHSLGSATVRAVYNNTTNIAVVTVTGPVLAHRYSFTADANDSVGTAHGRLINSATIANGAVSLPGGTASADETSSYVDFPNGMLTNFTATTFEAWVTDNESQSWARIWDFGNSSSGEDVPSSGVRWIYVGFNNGGNLLGSIHVNDRGGDSAVETPRPPTGQETHVVWANSIASHTSWLYVNGILKAVNPNTIVSPADIGPSLNNWLGRSQFNDPTFAGTISEFRIHNGALSPLQVAINSASGPDRILADPGALQGIRLTVATNTVSYGGRFVSVTAFADYASVTNVPVPARLVTFGSSNPSVVTVSLGGVLQDVGLGTANVTASFEGKTAEAPVTIASLPNPEPATLVHRYSFSEAAGSTTVDDSVGTADGTVKGTGATFGGGQLSVPGGTGSAADPVSGYVDLPNHIINVLSNVSVEAWITWEGASQWQRIFDFGTSAGGEDVSDGSGGYLFLSPQGAGNNLQFSVRDPVTALEPAPLTGGAPLPANQEAYLAVVYDFTDNVARLYSNSVAVVSMPTPVDITTIDDVNNWLGRSQWNDAMFQGKYNEFRIWKGVLLPDQIAAHYAAGPDSLDSLPKLAASVTGQNLVISWPASATGFVLESSPTLGTGATWTAVTPAPTISNGTSTVTVPIGNGTQFFRLKR